MAQKSNPISLRLRKTNKLWNSCWYGDYNYTKQLLQDRGVSAYIQNICQQAKMAPPVVFLNRQRQQTSTFFFFSRHQRMNRIKRPSRSPFQKSARGGGDWLHKLLFWSCKVPVHAPSKVNNNSFPWSAKGNERGGQPQLPLRAPAVSVSFHKTSMEKGLHSPPPTLGYSGGQLFGFFPYLLVSQAAHAQHSKPAENNLSRAQPCAWSTLHFIISTLKKNSYQNKTKHNSDQGADMRSNPKGDNMTPTLRYAPLALPKALHGGYTGIPFHLLKTCQQDWGFFAMRNQYFASARISASASFPGRLSRPPFPGRVPLRGSVNPARNAASPWRNHLESCISAQTHHNSALHFLLCPSVHQNPLFLATQLCFSLENRKTFRRLKDRLMQDISADSSIKGVRITCSGRVAARSKKAQKAKTESIQWGQTSLNVFSDLVDFASKSALTPFGKIGVKVWICYREIKKPQSSLTTG